MAFGIVASRIPGSAHYSTKDSDRETSIRMLRSLCAELQGPLCWGIFYCPNIPVVYKIGHPLVVHQGIRD
jgi:hypothetical protein